MATRSTTRGDSVIAPWKGTSTSKLVCSCALVVGVVVACGDRTGLPLPPFSCKETAQPVLQKVPNVYFILDRSKSMRETEGGPLSKWDRVRTDISALMVSLGPKAEFGAAVFPPYSDSTLAEACAAGQEVLSLRLGDGLSADSPGSTANSFLNDTLPLPDGGTPTAATFRALTDELAGFPGHTFAILATDGGPNCNSSLTCQVDTCTCNIDRCIAACAPNETNCCGPGGPAGPYDCLDSIDTIAAVGALAKANVPTFAIGVPGSEAYASVLDGVAQAGGTARSSEPYYYSVNTTEATGSSSLVAALSNIAERITACTLELKNNPPDRGQVNVVIDKTPVLPGTGGWTLDGNIVTLQGGRCDEAVAGAKVTITFGCATVN